MRDTKHVLVTGGAGFIGSHLVEKLLGEGKSVVVIDDFSTGRRSNLEAVCANPGLRVLHGTISGCAELELVVAGAEAVYHLAATVGVDLVLGAPLRVIDTNVHDTEVLLRAASTHEVPFLFVSTSEVYGRSAKREFDEDDDLCVGRPTLSRWSYSCSKLMAEFLVMACVQERGLPAIVARLFNTVGPRQTGKYGMVLPRFIAAAVRNAPLRVFGDGMQTRSFCYVGDTVEALMRLQNSPRARGGIFNVGGTEEITMLDLARLVVETTGSSSVIELVPYDEAYGPGFEDLRHGKPRLDRLEFATGCRPSTPLRTVIELTAEAMTHEFAQHRTPLAEGSYIPET